MLDSRARELHQLAVLDAGRTRGFACPAIQTFINVIDKTRVNRCAAFFDLNHLINTAARRVRFQMPQPVCWAMIQAQTTMHAARVVFINRLQTGDGAKFIHGELHASDEAAGSKGV